MKIFKPAMQTYRSMQCHYRWQEQQRKRWVGDVVSALFVFIVPITLFLILELSKGGVK